MKHFKASEFNEFDKMDKTLLAKLDELREKLGRPVIINSSYRRPDHPIEAVKDKPGEHTHGAAVDIHTNGGKPTFELVKTAIEIGFTRIGISRKKNFVHLGIGYPGGAPVTIWTY
tara:strand:- start:313 stop:657 length:345 start_codon:yes stop_codon:yes gene_type:complete